MGEHQVDGKRRMIDRHTTDSGVETTGDTSSAGAIPWTVPTVVSLGASGSQHTIALAVATTLIAVSGWVVCRLNNTQTHTTAAQIHGLLHNRLTGKAYIHTPTTNAGGGRVHLYLAAMWLTPTISTWIGKAQLPCLNQTSIPYSSTGFFHVIFSIPFFLWPSTSESSAVSRSDHPLALTHNHTEEHCLPQSTDLWIQ